MNIKSLPETERPRERLIKDNNLTLTELLAILISTGYKNKNSLDLARNIISRYGIYGIRYLSYNDLIKIKGINQAKATKILAALKFSRKLEEECSKPLIIKSPYSVFKFMNKFNFLTEKLVVFSINNKNQLINYNIYDIEGNMLKKIIHFIFKNNTNTIIIAHNHTSGVVKPSKEDIKFTNQLITLFSKLDIILLDHVIVTKKQYYSFRKNNLLK